MMLYAMRVVVVLAFLGLVAGCADNKPVRHLASDACMVKKGLSNRADVVALMGEPTSRRMVGPEAEEWVYYETDRSFLQDTPLVGGSFDADGYNMVVITFSGDIVATCRYSAYNEDEFDWEKGKSDR